MKKITTKILLSVFFIVFTGVSTVFACEASPGDPWFKEYYSYEIVLQDQFDNRFATLDIIDGVNYIYNNTNIPTYIVKIEPGLQVQEMTDLPFGYRPLYKLVNGKVYFWNWDYENSSWMMLDSNKLPLDDNIYNLSDLYKNSKQIMADDRPIDVKVPENINSSVILYSEGREQILKVNVNYLLNQGYNSSAGREGLEFCANWSANVDSPIPLDESIRKDAWWSRIGEYWMEFFANLF
jgi:hypothetical protein